MSFREFHCSTQLEKRLLRILLHILSSSLALPRRGRLAHDHCGGRQSAVVLLSFAFFPRAQWGRNRQSPIQIWETFLRFLNSCTWNYFASLAKVFKLWRGTKKAWRHSRVYILSSKHTYRPMRARRAFVFHIRSNYGIWADNRDNPQMW